MGGTFAEVMRLRIMIIADLLDFGGLETHIVSVVNELLRRGHQVWLSAGGVSRDIMSQITPASGFQYLSWSDSDESELASFQPDIIHAHPWTSIYRGYEWSQRTGAPFFVTVHGLYDVGLEKTEAGARISRAIAKIIAVDNAVAELLRRRTTCPEKVCIVRNGINRDQFQITPRSEAMFAALGLHPDRFTIVTSSRLGPDKAPPLLQLLDAAPAAAERLGGLNIIILGNGSYYDDLAQKAASVESSLLAVRMAGRQSQVSDYLNMADLVFACDRAAMEAMLCQRPVFACGISGFAGLLTAQNHDSVITRRSGYHTYKTAKLSAEIVRLARNEPVRTRAAADCYEIACGLYDIVPNTGLLESLYQRHMTDRREKS